MKLPRKGCCCLANNRIQLLFILKLRKGLLDQVQKPLPMAGIEPARPFRVNGNRAIVVSSSIGPSVLGYKRCNPLASFR